MKEKIKNVITKIKTSKFAQKVEGYKMSVVYGGALVGMGVANSPVLATSWSGFKQSMEGFFKHGLGGEGMAGIGIAIAAIGIVGAIISFVVHKFNPQSRMPGWITCLVIGLFGAIAMGGIEKPLQLLDTAKNTLFGWLGI